MRIHVNPCHMDSHELIWIHVDSYASHNQCESTSIDMYPCSCSFRDVWVVVVRLIIDAY